MDAFCRLLTVDLYCLLTQIYQSLCSCSKNLRKEIEAIRVQKKRDTERVQKRICFQTKNKNHGGIQKKNHFLVIRPSYTIRHKYPDPLTTYDGEERGEPRLIRLSDLSSSQVDIILNICDDQDEKEEECEEQECEEEQDQECEPCEAESSVNRKQSKGFWACQLEEFEYLMKDFLVEKRRSVSLDSVCSEDPPKPRQLIQKEQRARTLYEKSTCQNPDTPATPWDRLKFTEKLRFHWRAHAGWELQETPFDNFRLCFMKNRSRLCPKMGIRKVRSEMRLRWCNMDRRGRMPFILQALLYQVTKGALDPADHCAVREFFQQVK